MGLILSRFYDKPTTRDTLEKIEQELQNIEERRWDKIKREQFIVQILSFLPITIFIANVCILIYPSDSTWRDKLLLSVPIAIINLILWVCKKIIQWYSKWSLDNEETRLRKLQKEKKRILEMVCETESYRVATELLEKYDPKQLRRREKAVERPPAAAATNLNLSTSRISASPIRSPKQQQQFNLPKSQPLSPGQFHNLSLQPVVQLPVPAPPPPTPVSKPIPQSMKSQLNTTSSNLLNASMTNIAASSVQGRPVRPILSKDRTFFEKVVDWVVADGPDNRFALICRFCYGHNGMSLAEEFETINFRCCYCYNLNTAIGKKPQSASSSEKDKPDSESKEVSDNNNTLSTFVEEDQTKTADGQEEESAQGKSKKKSRSKAKQTSSEEPVEPLKDTNAVTPHKEALEETCDKIKSPENDVVDKE